MIMNYIKYIFFFIGVVFLSACAQKQLKKDHVLYNQFIAYKQIKIRNANQRPYFSVKLWQSLEKAKSQSSVNRGMASVFLKYPDEIQTITGRDEVINGQRGCLLVMGLSSKKKPTDYMIRFISKGGHWVFDDIQVKYYLDGTKRYLNRAVCDVDQQQQIWLKYMKSQNR